MQIVLKRTLFKDEEAFLKFTKKGRDLKGGVDKEFDMTPSEEEAHKKIFLVVNASEQGCQLYLRTIVSGHRYSFAIKDFGGLKTFEKSPLPDKDYNLFCQIWEEDAIPEVYDRLYDIIGMKLSDFRLTYITKDILKSLIKERK